MRTFNVYDHGNILAHQSASDSVSHPPSNAVPNLFVPPGKSITLLPPIGTPPSPSHQTRDASIVQQPEARPESLNLSLSKRQPLDVTLHLPQSAVGTQEVQLQTLYERLAENERSQRALAVETARLHGQLNESFRFHDGILRDEVQMRRVLEDHFQFLRSIVRHLQDQFSVMSQQLTLEREAAFHSIELTKIRAEEHERFAELMRKRGEEDAEKIAILTNELILSRREVATLRSDMDARITMANEEMKRCSAGLERVDGDGTQCKHEIEAIKISVGQMDARITNSLQRADANLAQASKSLHDYIASTQSAEEEQLKKMRDELLSQSAQQDQSHTAAEELRHQELRVQIDQLMKTVGDQQSTIVGLERKLQEQLEAKVNYVESSFRDIVMHQKTVHEQESREMLKAIQALHSFARGSREEERKNREMVRKELLQAKMELQRDAEEARRDLETQMRRMTKPFIVI
ncbi:uncharacterized protein SPPG_00968 [Spizellomyces punctatus DAOM BR117]|uniref:Uncharacterized protein n=1 Tax=Spizellomyces punctatus (strain DAOM BR117) TaxID=645134 RepID=A0A0L0HRI6_SPIPD|nr:uncharacterized protein SPPG_00968 [Spizellomyces punctatus DAOM BR117]KND03484.1 hypothetical protein SPPG_00968 [Spizellomyces punctatus DAOM BR117]|eukprot:XP_016611523.1 hypothetical protein SPPG_00968 [Spizellomyces punctatus DAOM BR117]